MEEWKDIVGFEGVYQVSNEGRVRSLYGNHKAREKILRLYTNKSNYWRVHLCSFGKDKRFLVSRLVAQAFIPNPDNLPQVNHIDGNKNNNTIGNLEWITMSNNLKHAFKLGLQDNRGEKAPHSTVYKIYKKERWNSVNSDIPESEKIGQF